MDLAECGAIPNHKKSVHKGKAIGSFLTGTQKLYDFVNNCSFIGNL
jgi:acyl-CoA hydrolase